MARRRSLGALVDRARRFRRGLGVGSFVAAPLLGLLLAAIAFRPALADDELPSPDDDRDAALVDTDRDGLADVYEHWIGTDPERCDTDGDGFPDGYEVARHSSPLVPSVPPADESGIALDFIPEPGGVRIVVTVFSRSGYGIDTGLGIIAGIGERWMRVTREMISLGRIFRSGDGRVVGYASKRLPLANLPPRLSLGAVLRTEDELVVEDALVGVRGRQFYRTEITPLSADTWIGGTVFLTVTVLTEEEPGFSPNEDCKQVFGRLSGPVKLILDEFCEDQLDRYCPENCGSDVGLRVVCIRELFRI